MKVAFYSPLPPERSGIADYSALLLPALSEHLEVEVARRGRFGLARVASIESATSVSFGRRLAGLPRRVAWDPKADVCLYHVGNDPEAHGWIVEALRRRPGVVVLHEFVLHHLVSGLTLARGDAAGYLNALEREAGVAGRLLGYAVMESRIEPLWEACPQDFPLAGEVLDHATGLIVHSRYVERRVREAGYAGPVWRIPMPAWSSPEFEPASVGGRPLIGCFGHINESKRIPQLLAAFDRLRETHPEAQLLLVGSASTRLPALDLADGVVREEYVPEERLWALMAACDVHVSLRAPTMGETSAVVVRSLSLGKPLVVSDVGWFAELPGEVALKVPVDELEVDALTAALERLAGDEGLRAAMGAAARELVEREHRLERVAELYAAALEEAAGGETVRDAVLYEVATAAAAVGLEETALLAERLEEVGLGR